MIFFRALPREAVCPNNEMTLGPPSEREVIAARIKAASRIRHKRVLLKFGLAAIRRLRKQLKSLSM